jgi:hypothetical protein
LKEAEYAEKKKKLILPLLMQSGFEADGWLGLLIGARIYVNFASSPFESAMADLKKQLDLLRVRPMQGYFPNRSSQQYEQNSPVQQQQQQQQQCVQQVPYIQQAQPGHANFRQMLGANLNPYGSCSSFKIN